MSILSFLVLAFACDQNNDFVTESGTEVTVLTKGDGGQPQPDSILLLHLKMATAEGEVLMESSEEKPLPVPYSDTLQAGHLQEVLTNLEIGDSVYFETTIQNLFEETYRSPVPQQFSAEGIVQVNLRVADQMSEQEFNEFSRKKQEEQRIKEQAMLEEKATTDAAALEAYFEKENIDATTTESGLSYVITEEGSGPTADPGDKVRVHYTGTLLDGEKFDSSRDRGEPLEFVLGRGRVIPGWDEGIGYIKEGGSAKLYIPSPLAYGSRSPSPKIPPYSILVFDVEVVEVIEQNGQQN